MREAISDLIFAASTRTELGGNSYVDLTWSPTPASPARTAAITAAVDDAYRAFAERDLRRAWEILRSLPPQDGPVRRLRIDVLTELEMWDEVIDALGEPTTQEELMVLVDAFCHLGSPQQARESIQAYAKVLHLAPDLRAQLEARISIKESSA